MAENEKDSGGKPGGAVVLPPEVMELHAVRKMSLVRAWREHLGLTQDEVAQRLGVSRPAYVQMETSKTRPRVITLKKIAAALGVEWEQLRD
jgi:DNA-binding XRE family transcriptional regulator